MLKRVGIFLLLMIINFIFKNVVGDNYLVNRNSLEMKKFLAGHKKKTGIKDEGLMEDILLLDYDKVHVFSKEDTKEDIIDKVGFKSSRFNTSKEEDILNILFLYQGRESVYLYGHPRDTGYYIEISPGEYSKEEIEKLSYIREKKELKNPRKNGRKAYINYRVFINK